MTLTHTIAAAMFSLLPVAPLVAIADDESDWLVVDDFGRPDSLYHGDGWESLNPGYWQIADGGLRRRIQTSGIGYTSWAPS